MGFRGKRSRSSGICREHEKRFETSTHFWWFRNPAITSWYGRYLIIYRVSCIPGGCWGFLNHQRSYTYSISKYHIPIVLLSQTLPPRLLLEHFFLLRCRRFQPSVAGPASGFCFPPFESVSQWPGQRDARQRCACPDGTGPNVRHGLAHADACQRSAPQKSTGSNVRHRFTHSDTDQRCAVCKGTVRNIHLPFQLSYMLIWDKVNNHGNGSNASQTHMLEKHHHWGSAVRRYELLGLPTGLGWLEHPTNSKKCVSKQMIFPILMKIHTHTNLKPPKCWCLSNMQRLRPQSASQTHQ